MHCTFMVADGRGGAGGQTMNLVIIKHALKHLQGQKCPPSHGIKEPKEKTIQLFGGRSK